MGEKSELSMTWTAKERTDVGLGGREGVREAKETTGVREGVEA